MKSFYLQWNSEIEFQWEELELKLTYQGKNIKESFEETETFYNEYNSCRNWLDECLKEVCDITKNEKLSAEEKFQKVSDFKEKLENQNFQYMIETSKQQVQKASNDEKHILEKMTEQLNRKVSDLTTQSKEWMILLKDRQKILSKFEDNCSGIDQRIQDLEQQLEKERAVKQTLEIERGQADKQYEEQLKKLNLLHNPEQEIESISKDMEEWATAVPSPGFKMCNDTGGTNESKRCIDKLNSNSLQLSNEGQEKAQLQSTPEKLQIESIAKVMVYDDMTKGWVPAGSSPGFSKVKIKTFNEAQTKTDL